MAKNTSSDMNPEKAAASEARRAKRAKAGKKSTRKAG